MEALLRGGKAALEQAAQRVKGNASTLTGKTVAVESFRVRVGAPLADGGFGVVYAATDVATGAQYALKHVLPGDSAEALAVARAEVAVGSSLAAHPHAVRLLAAAPRPPAPRQDALLLMELCGASLAARLHAQPGGLAEREALLSCRAAASVLAALHAAGVWHWDVKPENLLRSADGAAWKLGDYGSSSSRAAGPASPAERGLLEDAIARTTTPAFRAPEMWDLAAHGALGPAADIWALGCLLGAALGAPPFGAEDKLRILSGAYRPPPRASLGAVALQQRCLARAPEARPTALEALDALDALLAEADAAQATAALPAAQATAAPPAAPPADAGWCANFD